MAGREEQETIVTQNRLDEYVDIWSNNIVDVRKLEKEPRAVRESPEGDITADELSEHLDAGFGVTYRVSTGDFTPLGGFRRKRVMTDEQKAAAGERLRAARGQK